MEIFVIVWITFSFLQFSFLVESFGNARKTYRFNSEEKTWFEARKICQDQDGDLAVITDPYDKRARYLVRALEETPNSMAWVAGRGFDDGWNWYDKPLGDAGSLMPMKELIAYKGCVKPQFIMGGIRMSQNNAEACFKRCQWKGAVALKSWFCICEWRLRNITTISDEECDIKCPGQTDELCGGIHGVSLYHMNERSVLWGDGEPFPNMECVYINKAYDKTLWSWHSANCHTIMKFLCRYDDHHICGVHPTCVRPSTRPTTWQDAVVKCRQHNGTIATVDVTQMYANDDVISIPPGQFWVGLRKRQEWKWTNGRRIPAIYFHSEWYDKCKGDTCVVLHKKGDLKLAGDLCDNKRPFICEFYKEYSSPVRKTTILEQEKDATIVVSSNDNKTSSNNVEQGTREDMYKSVMYTAIGVACGMAFVFSICIIGYVARRCRQRARWKARGGYRQRRVTSKGWSNSVKSSATVSNSTDTEVLYDIPSGGQESESPFRQTQRALRQEAMRETPYTHTRRGSDGYRSLSWKRVPTGSNKELKQKERQFSRPEIRSVYTGPSSERSFCDASYMIHQVQAQCHSDQRQASSASNYIDRDRTTKRTRRFSSDYEYDDAIRLAETYSQPAPSRKVSENEGTIQVDTSDLYACVQKVMSQLGEDKSERV